MVNANGDSKDGKGCNVEGCIVHPVTDTPLHFLGKGSYAGYLSGHSVLDAMSCHYCTKGENASYVTGHDVPGSFVE